MRAPWTISDQRSVSFRLARCGDSSQLLAGNELDRQAERHLEDPRVGVRRAAGRDAPELDRGLGGHPLLDRRDAARAGECADRVFLDRRADELELARVELDARLAEGLAQEEPAVEMADREPVGLRDAIEMIRQNEAAGAGHVLDDERRIAGNVPAHVAREHSRVRIESAAGGEAHDQPDGLALVEGLGAGAADPGGDQDRGGRERDKALAHTSLLASAPTPASASSSARWQ